MTVRILIFLLSALLALPASARNLALVIGNDDYLNVPPLQKATADARGYAEFLGEAGFDVTLRTDLDWRAMQETLALFFDSIRPGDTAAFIYAGHGWSDGRENFLVPTDIRAGGSETLIARESFALRNGVNGIVDEIHQRGPQLTVAIIDACRNNPFDIATGTRSFGLERGLAPVEAPVGTFVAFSAGAGQTALDRLSDDDPVPYSVFTRNFLDQLRRPQDLQSAFKATQLAVNELALSIGHAQRPAYYDEVIGSACLTGACVPAPVVLDKPQPGQPSLDAAAEWQDFRDSRSPTALRLFAERHAGTAYAALALERVAMLEAARAPVPAQPPEQPPEPQPPEQTPEQALETQPEPQPVPPTPPQEVAKLPAWCPNAATVTEKAICTSTRVASLDNAMTALFLGKRKLLAGPSVERFTSEQRAWLAVRDACGANVDCLVAAYTQRIARLR